MPKEIPVLFELRPLLRTGYVMVLTSTLMGAVMGVGFALEYFPVAGMMLGGGILIIGIMTFLFCFFYLHVVVSAETLSVNRWSSREVINKKDLHAVQFTAKDVQLITSHGTRKLSQFTRKRKEFVDALKVNAPQLTPFLDSELQKGEQLRLQELKDGLIIAVVVIGLDWPILLIVTYSLSLPSWVTLLFLCLPIPGLLALYWYHRRVNYQLHSLTQD